jgi:hypothetical protein
LNAKCRVLIRYNVIFVVGIAGLMLRWHVDLLCWQFNPSEVLEHSCVMGRVQV